MYQMTPEDLKLAIDISVWNSRSYAKKAGLDDGHYEDMIQEALERVIKYSPRFNPHRGIKFKTYAETCIRGAILDYLRANDPLSRRARTQIKSQGWTKVYGDVVTGWKPVEMEKAFAVSYQMTDSLVPDLKFEVLEDRELVVMSLFLDGFLQAEIGDTLGVTESRANQLIKKACEKLRRAAEGKYVKQPKRTAKGKRFVQESIRKASRKYGSGNSSF